MMSTQCRATFSLRRLRGIFLFAISIPLLNAACAINPKLDLAELSSAEAPVSVTQVPFYPQLEYQCGPAALAGALGAAGVETDPAALAPQVYLPARQGSLQVELLAATRRAGRVAYLPGPDPRELIAQLESGRPVLVLQNLRTRHFPVWHYALVVGYDPMANRLLLNSGEQQGMSMDARRFMRTWDWAGRWSMVVLEPGALPANPDVHKLLVAVAAFEAVAGAEAALPSWRAIANHWPRDSRAHLALGNAAYARQDLPGAITHYENGLREAPGDPALANNLASVLGELGCGQAAVSLLSPVAAEISEDSRWHGIVTATLAEVERPGVVDSATCADFREPASKALSSN
jgi:tetratricopeptide (TPR) repeat protein